MTKHKEVGEITGEKIYELCGGLELSTQRKVDWWELSPNWRDFYNRIAKAVNTLSLPKKSTGNAIAPTMFNATSDKSTYVVKELREMRDMEDGRSNKSNEEIVEEFEKEFPQPYRLPKCTQKVISNWLRTHLTQREIKLPEKEECKIHGDVPTGNCHICIVHKVRNNTINDCQAALDGGGE